MQRRDFLRATTAAGAALAAGRAWSANAAPRPNFLIIVADDMGWADVGCYGRDDVKTPAIDSLARDGMKFEHAYANSSVCTPTRVALATGRYQNRLPIGQEEPLGTAKSGSTQRALAGLAAARRRLPDLARRQMAPGLAGPLQPDQERLPALLGTARRRSRLLHSQPHRRPRPRSQMSGMAMSARTKRVT